MKLKEKLVSTPMHLDIRLKKNDIIVWCSNDYLGMSQNKLVINSMINSVKRMGTGSGGTRNISGNSNAIVQLENELADFHLKEKAVVFSSGMLQMNQQ